MDMQALIDKAKAQQIVVFRKRLEKPGPLTMTLNLGTSGGLHQEAQHGLPSIVLGILGGAFTFGGFGIALGLIESTTKDGKRTEPAMGWIFGAVGLGILALAYSFVASRNTLTLDPMDRSWARERGIRPKSQKTRGLYSELAGLSFTQESRAVKSQSILVWATNVVWKDSSQLPFCVAILERDDAWSRREEALAAAQEFASRVGLTILATVAHPPKLYN